MKKGLLIILIHCFTQFTILSAQDISLPPISSLKSEQDLERTSADLVRAASWLEKTPFNTSMDKRKEVEKFVFMWVSASKKINVEMNYKILQLDDINPGIVMIYTAATASYLVQNKSASTTDAQISGLKKISKIYRSSKAIKKDKLMDSLIKAERKGKIFEWLSTDK